MDVSEQMPKLELCLCNTSVVLRTRVKTAFAAAPRTDPRLRGAAVVLDSGVSSLLRPGDSMLLAAVPAFMLPKGSGLHSGDTTTAPGASTTRHVGIL